MPSEEGEPADATLVGRLRAGDSDAFAEVVRAWSPMMFQAARAYVSTDASAQEVVQDAWLAMIRGLDKFEGRSSLRTWLLAILGYQEFVVKRQLWHFGMDPDQVAKFLADYGWSETEQMGPQEFTHRYLRPSGRVLPVSEIERFVYARKI